MVLDGDLFLGTVEVEAAYLGNVCVASPGNFVRISTSGNIDGLVVELGGNYDTSDLTNNPPIVYGPDGTTVSGSWFSRVRFSYNDIHSYEFNDSVTPTSYFYTKDPL